MFPNVRNKTRRSDCDPQDDLVSELSRHLLRVQETERKRISRELHDGTGQNLMTLRLYLAMLANDGQTPDSQAKIQEALQLVDHTVDDLRRIISRLSPRVLEEFGLLAAIRKEVFDLAKNTAMHLELNLPEEIAVLDHECEVTIYRSLQECLHNIAKHSQAGSFAVRLSCNANSVCLVVEDDGQGMSLSNSSLGDTYGLRGMRERVAALGGNVQLRSRREKGVCVKVTLPIVAQLRKHAVGDRRAVPVRTIARVAQASPREKPLVFASKLS